jgi:Biotin and Thiamin Synthesis associated domain
MKFTELSAIYGQPLFDLISRSRQTHLRNWRGHNVQRCDPPPSIKNGHRSEETDIVGLGEAIDDQLRMLEVFSTFNSPPESVLINCLLATPGTPLAEQPPLDIFELVRLVAVARLALPKARIRLDAGRTRLSREGQALCFFAGANSIFSADKLLTAENLAADADVALLRELGLKFETEEAAPSAINGATISNRSVPANPRKTAEPKPYVEPPPGSLMEILTRLRR